MMRLLLASVATLAAVALAVPAYAQQEAAPATATPTPIAKPKPGTTAYCNTLKSANSRSACLKRVHASAPKAPATTATAKKTKTKKLDAAKSDSSASLTDSPAVTPVQAPASPQTVSIPPLPQKTI
jgi:hypothetical protein